MGRIGPGPHVGWYNGVVCVHDLRSSSRITLDDANPHNPASLLPVLSLYDSFSFDPIYAVACGGGSTSHIEAGTARHSVIAFWDVRRPTQGWRVHAPGNDSSLVYSKALAFLVLHKVGLLCMVPRVWFEIESEGHWILRDKVSSSVTREGVRPSRLVIYSS